MKVPYVPLYVDEFPSSVGVENSFFGLTHFHTDHMKGLTDHWTSGTILTSVVTGELLVGQYPKLRNRIQTFSFFERVRPFPNNEVYITLIPSFHIPGSAMFYIETQEAIFLHTGDFKYEHPTTREICETFFASRRVDHLFLDDTWLHLGVMTEARGNNGSTVLTKLLNATQLEEAIDSLGRRMDMRRAQQKTEGTKFPFFLRIYLHNQFGKELIVQKIAERLGTRVMVCESRYARLSILSEALKREETSSDFSGNEAWRAIGGESGYYAFDKDRFTTVSATAEAAEDTPLIEIVSKRSEIDPTLLERLSTDRNTPTFGLVMSGWARSRGTPSSLVWHMPSTLHCTPQEIIDFVKLIRPKSVTPLHPRPSRSNFILTRLGPFLETPFRNDYFCAARSSPVERTAGVHTSEEGPVAIPSNTPFGFSLQGGDEEDAEVLRPLWSNLEINMIDSVRGNRKRSRCV